MNETKLQSHTWAQKRWKEKSNFEQGPPTLDILRRLPEEAVGGGCFCRSMRAAIKSVFRQ